MSGARADGIAEERAAWNKIMGAYRQAIQRPKRRRGGEAVPHERRPTTVVVRVLNHSYAFDGPGVLDALRTLHVPHMRSRLGREWLCPADHGERVYNYVLARGHHMEARL